MQRIVDLLREPHRLVAQIIAHGAARHQRGLGASLERTSRWVALGRAQIQHQAVTMVAKQASRHLPGSPAMQRNVDVFELARGHT